MAQSFPDAWIGIWKGDMQIFKGGKVMQTVPMEVHISKGDSAKTWNWRLIYAMKKDSPDVRPYVVIEKDAAKGVYVMDEKNSILLDSYYIGGVFYSVFDVQGTVLNCSYRMQGKNLVSEIVYGKSEPIRTSGGTSEEVPPVKSYLMSGLQRCVMKRYKK